MQLEAGTTTGSLETSDASEKLIAKKKVRVQFEFTLEALARLDAMKQVTDAPTRAEVLRKALRLYEWFVNEAKSDNIIMSVDENGQTVSQFPASLLIG